MGHAIVRWSALGLQPIRHVDINLNQRPDRQILQQRQCAVAHRPQAQPDQFRFDTVWQTIFRKRKVLHKD